MSETLTITRPDDWHLHLRDADMLRTVLPFTCRQFSRAIVMPNLVPPVCSLEDARAYRQRILDALPGPGFTPLMTLYLNAATTPDLVRAAADCDWLLGIKLYPADATTHSEAGVKDIATFEAVFAAMAEFDLPLLVHGESTEPGVDIFDREARFIDSVLSGLLERHPKLRVVLEHVSTRHGVEFVRSKPANLGATITPQHLFMNRNAMLAGGLRPHNYCLPVLKRESDRAALVAAATSGDARFFLGTDSAPHKRSDKESACGCAGTFNVLAALPVYAQVFEAAGALDQLEKFTSLNGPSFYRLPVNTETLTLLKSSWTVPQRVGKGDTELVPWLAGATLDWKVVAS